jgi:hypothetical protein
MSRSSGIGGGSGSGKGNGQPGRGSLARPAGMRQLASSFALVWDDVLPPTPQDIWDENLALVVRSLEEQSR